MTLGNSHTEANGSWLTYSGSFLKDSDAELSVTDSVACEVIPIYNFFFCSKYASHFQFVLCLQDLCLERSCQIYNHLLYLSSKQQWDCAMSPCFYDTSSHLITNNLA